MIEAVKAEYAIGLSQLPAYGFTEMFRQKEENLIKESMDTMKNWLGIIKQGRIVHNDPRLKDGYCENKALKNHWI